MRWLALVIVFALAAPAAAASHKILVLPVDGTADAATRAKLTAEVARLARTLDGQVATGNATFADTALAVGCDPQAARCRDEVIATLGVDELIWGTASRDGAQTRLVVRRAAKGVPAREVSTMVASGDPGDRIAAGIAPLFAPPAATPDATAPRPTGAPPEPAPAVATDLAAPASDPTQPVPAPGPTDDRRDRTVGIVVASCGGLGLVFGLSLWASYSSLQSSIDAHPVRTYADIQDLKALEDKASTRAIAGDVFVLAGLVAAGVGGYYLYRDHTRHAVAIAPLPIAHGGGLAITLIGDLGGPGGRR
ncbi:MAG TPA: hypothetical protein VF469_13835 [Kofleriaceae bacterium]